MKYKKHILGLIIYFAVALMALFAIPKDSLPFVSFFPRINTGTDVFLLFIFYMLMILILGISLGFLLVPIYLFLHKKIIGRKMIYGIKERDKPKEPKGLFRAFFPSLMAINIAIMLAPYLYHLVLIESRIQESPGEILFLSFVTLLIFTLGPVFALFIVVWILDDAGIGYTNREKVKNTGEFIEYRSLGGWYHQFLKGYAGIGVIFAFYIIINAFFTTVLAWSSDFGQVAILFIIIIPIPIFCILAAIPTLLILDMFREKSVNYARKMAKKIGITEELIYSEE